MKIDLHVHSRYSYDSAAMPETILKWARMRGMDGICITEHHSYLSSGPFAEWAEQSGILILRGAEASTTLGHFLLYGISDDDWNTHNQSGYIDPQRLIDHVNDLGGAVVAAHPFRQNGERIDGWKIASLRGLAAIEVWNGNCTEEENREARLLAQKMGLPGIGGSDAHVGAMVGMAYTVLLQKVTGEKDLVQVLKKGRCNAGGG